MTTTLAAVMSMPEKVATLWPEIVLFAGSCVVMIVGLSRSYPVRKLCGLICVLALGLAGFLAFIAPPTPGAMPNLAGYGKVLTAVVGLVLVLLLAGTADRDYEAQIARGETFNPLKSNRGEFYAFVLFSLTGLMLCAGADDLIWLFLALELTSLPTYIMVSISTSRNRSMEAGVKYFFLGALGAATFLMGFTLLYGGTGTTNVLKIQQLLAAQSAAGGINAIAMAGLVMSVLGIAFKIAAVPMHFYTPDVYQGASASVAAFLAFVPKAAGFFALLVILGTVGWNSAGGRLPTPLHELLWVMAALTMTVGNVLAVLQTSVKRTLAYSSVAHSGYMLVGLVAGPGKLVPDESGFLSATFTGSGLSALLFYLLSYGVMNLGAFAVLASLERTGRDGQPEEIDSFADLRGLCRSSPVLGYTMVLSALGLLGLPPTLGFFAKLPLFTSAISSGQAVLVVILGINSAIAAFYYLKLAGTPWLESADTADGQSPPNAHPDGLTPPRLAPFPARTIAGVASAVGVVVLAVVPFTGAANHAAVYRDSTFDPSERAPGLTKPVRSAGAETTPTPNAPANP